MGSLRLFATAFAGGAAFEALCVFWVRAANDSKPLRAALVGALEAAAVVLGVGAAVRGVPGAIGYVLGCAAGTGGAVAIGAWWQTRRAAKRS